MENLTDYSNNLMVGNESMEMVSRKTAELNAWMVILIRIARLDL